MPAKLKRKSPVRNEIIETELGLERRCTKCDESYPLESDFFYKDGKDKAGRAKFTTQCKDCYKQSYRIQPSSRSKTEVTGDDLAIKREFERIERNQKISDLGDMLEAIDYLEAKQAKSPSAVTDGL
jgi:hypothetical protein